VHDAIYTAPNQLKSIWCGVRICVLRRGRQIGIRAKQETSNNENVSLITGLA
jgi:hypothetical protein